VVILPVVNYMNRSDVAHHSIQFWLRLYADAISEYHSITGEKKFTDPSANPAAMAERSWQPRRFQPVF
jgi:hypothetical protein